MKRSRKQVKRSRRAILAEAARLRKAGIGLHDRNIVIGGKRPVSVNRELEKEGGNDDPRTIPGADKAD